MRDPLVNGHRSHGRPEGSYTSDDEATNLFQTLGHEGNVNLRFRANWNRVLNRVDVTVLYIIPLS